MAASSKLAPGQLLCGRFEVLGHHRRGGMGDVYRAVDRGDGAPVAIKVCLLPEDADALKRFAREAALLATVAHPRVVRLLAHDALPEGAPFYVMPFVDAPTLAGVLSRGRAFTVAEAVTAVGSLLEGLAALHMRGISHRDVTPKNVAIDPGTLAITILDLGLAKSLVGHEVGVTQDGHTVGTPAYMAPEQTLGFGDARADVYAAGLILYQLLTGARPFAEHGKRELATRIAFPAPPARAPRGAAPLPPSIVAAVAHALERDPDRRPADAMQLLVALHRAAAAAGLPRTAAPPAERLSATGDYTAPVSGRGEATESGFGAVALSGLSYLVGVRALDEACLPRCEHLAAELAGEPLPLRAYPPDVLVVAIAATAVDPFLARARAILGPSTRFACEPLPEGGCDEAAGSLFDRYGPEVAAILGELLS